MSARKSETGSRRRVKVDYLARVEGEGALDVRVRDGRVVSCQLKIFEPPRFYEGFLRGRHFLEVPDITARICGICPIAYMNSSAHALERACGVRVEGQIRELRRLVYCGEWIESHALHVYMLHAPDFLGYESAVHMAPDHPEVVRKALRLKKIGNDLMVAVGGREIHPVNLRVGGFWRAPRRRDLLALRGPLEEALALARETVRLVAGFDFPDFEQDYEFVALCHGGEYPLNEGRLVSNRGLDCDIADFDEHFEERHEERSNALHVLRRGGGAYLVGPLARYALNHDLLTPEARDAAREAGLGPVERNPFRSIVVRSVEMVFACEEALRILDAYEEPDPPFVEVEPRAATGWGCTEAPRGICWHAYEIDAQGIIRQARIVPPTAQNQKRVEEDLVPFVEARLDLDQEALTWQCEMTVRNYDPCISCATHFLRLDLREEEGGSRGG